MSLFSRFWKRVTSLGASRERWIPASPCVGAGRDCLLGALAQHHRRDRPAAEVLRRRLVGALQDEQARDAAVVLLGERAHLSRADDAHEPGLLEHLQVVADGALRHLERGRELGRARGALVQQRDDPPAGRVGDGAERLGLLDGEDVVEVVVGKTVDDRRTYGKSRPFASRFVRNERTRVRPGSCPERPSSLPPWSRSWSRSRGARSSRRGISRTRSRSPAARSSARPATRASSRTSAARPSRSRRFRSFVPGPTSTTPRSRSRARPTSRGRSSSRRCARSSPRPTRPRTTSSAAPSPRGSSTTAPGSTPG